MRKQIFQAIAEHLAKSVPEVRFIDLWNNNIATLAGGSTWPMPAVFIEFEPIEWGQLAAAAREGDVGVRLHIVTRAVATNGHTDKRQTAALEYFGLIDKINAAMAMLKGENFSAFMLTTSATNHEHGEILESVERHVARTRDTSALRPALQPTAAPKVSVRPL